MFYLLANKNRLTLRIKETVTSGSIDVYKVHVDFSSDWDGFTRTAVFRNDNVERKISVLMENGECSIPWEVLVEEGDLYLGVYGDNGDRRLPTIWTKLCEIERGAEEGDNMSPPPDKDLWEQELDEIKLLIPTPITNSELEEILK